MSYKDFTLEIAKEKFDLKSKRSTLFPKLQLVADSELTFLKQVLERNQQIALKSEKSRSESLVFPILIELIARNKNTFTFFSDETFDVDKKQGLTGRCDYLLCNSPSDFVINAPVFALVEAKQGILEKHIGQCVAEMIAAQIFNQHHQKSYPIIYGAVTSGVEWLFLTLENKTVTIDTVSYFVKVELQKIVSILQTIVDSYKKQAGKL